MTPTPEPLPRVLAVDDLEENLVALEALLRKEGVVVDLARSGREALEHLLRHQYAVALVDVQMPEMSGFELARLMRGAERSKHVPVVFVTAGGVDAASVFEGYDAGAVDFLFKPVEPHVLRSKVRVFLELDRQRRDLARSALENRRLADEARAAAERLGETTALLDAIFEHAPIGIAFFDAGLRFQRVNAALAATNGIPAEAHLGKTVAELLPGLPAHEMERRFREVIASGRPVTDVEVVGATPATRGARHVWRVSSYPVTLGRRVIGVGSLVRDVTLDKRAEEMERLLVGIVGHDLRSPLSAIATSLQLLLRGEPLGEKQRSVVTRMSSATDRMTRLVNDLVEYTRVRAGGALAVVPRPVSLCEVVAAAVDEARAASPGQEVTVSAHGDVEGEWDPDRLRQLLGNLVGNALKHGRRDAPVAVSIRGAADEVELEVTNQGEPIPPEQLGAIFEPLVQGEGGASRGGAGLGLFISRAIVDAHGGAIDVRSDRDGTAFRVRLPRRAPSAAPPPSPP